MSIPKGLKFENRLAKYGEGWLFVCQRKKGIPKHPPIQKFLPTSFKTDAESFRAAHDTAFHSPLFAHVGFEPAKNIAIKQLCKDWLDHVAELEKDGDMHPSTVRHYFYCCDNLIVPAFEKIHVRTVRELDPSTVSASVRWMKHNTNSEGASITKALTALRTMIRWRGLRCDWVIPSREIHAKRREKRDLDAKTVVRFIRAMPPGTLERAAAVLKARTGARDIEIYDARKDEFTFGLTAKIDGKHVVFGLFAPMLHSKRRQKPHVYVLTADVVSEIAPLVQAAPAGGRVFRWVESDRRVTADGMRKRYIRASKLAGIDPPIQSLAPIRSEVVTIVADEAGLKHASEHVTAHAKQATTEKWYYKFKVTPKKIESRLRIANMLAKSVPLTKARKTA